MSFAVLARQYNWQLLIESIVANPSAINERDEIGSTALHYAARFGNVPAVNTLVSAGADVDIVTMSGMTGLAFAADMGELEIVKTLIQAGADVSDGDTAAHRASMNGHWEIVVELLRAGASAQVTNNNGKNISDVAHSGYTRRIIRETVTDLASH